MTAFAIAAATLAADPNLGADATYTPLGGSPSAVRVLLSNPEQSLPLGSAWVTVAETVITVTQAAVSDAVAGDTYAIGSVTYQALAAEADAHAATWRVPCRRLDPASTGTRRLQAAAS